MNADLIVVPTIGGPIEPILESNRTLVHWLSEQGRQGKSIASNCTGSFILAEAGLLDGRIATTHWGFSGLFQSRYPQVHCQPERLITVDGPIACAGGGMAWWDLGVYIVEQYAGAQTARELAQAFVIDAGRNSQAPYAALQGHRYHQDETILTLQDWMERHYQLPVDTRDLADRSGLSERSLLRRFRQATGDTPHRYLQLLRIEAARRALESSDQPLQRLVQALGYDDVSSFSRLFRRHTGVSPGQYRARFRR